MKYRVSTALVAALGLAACAVPAESTEDLGARGDALVNRNCTSTTGAFANRSPRFYVSAQTLTPEASRSTAFGESTLVIPPGTTKTTISTTPRLLSARVSVIGPPLAFGGQGNVTLALIVKASDGSTLCRQDVTVVSKSTVGIPVDGAIPGPTNYPMTCSFDHDTRGLPVTARLELSAFAETGGGQTAAGADGPMPTFTQQHCQIEHGWCVHPGARLLSLDINGDGKTDHLCHTASTSHLQVNVTPSSGVPDDVPDYDFAGFCGGTDVLLTGDVNNDGGDDLVCVTPSTRRVRVKIADRRAGFPAYAGTAETITAPTGVPCNSPQLGDFDGDGRADLLCDRGDGARTSDIVFVNTEARFLGRDGRTSNVAPPCATSLRPGDRFYVGDFNRDGRDDLFCHRPGFTNTVRLAATNGTFPTSMAQSAGAFCTHTGGRIAIADADGDGRKDLVCLTSGYVHVDLASASSPIFGGSPERSFAAGFCPTGGEVTAVDYRGDDHDGLTCQVPAVAPGFGRITLQPRL